MQVKRAGQLFWLLVLLHLAAMLPGYPSLQFITKPLLMPALSLAVCSVNARATGKRLVLSALFFSWLGDVLLLFESRHAFFFIAGLVSFLLTHCCYIIYFLSARADRPSLLVKQPVFILLIACYGAGLVWFLFPYLGALKIPVVFYAAVICCMMASSLHIFLKIKSPANKYFVAGAGLFMLSDSLLAINKFYQHIPLAGIGIMLSYCAAQYGIISGFLARSR